MKIGLRGPGIPVSSQVGGSNASIIFNENGYSNGVTTFIYDRDLEQMRLTVGLARFDGSVNIGAGQFYSNSTVTTFDTTKSNTSGLFSDNINVGAGYLHVISTITEI